MTTLLEARGMMRLDEMRGRISRIRLAEVRMPERASYIRV